MITAVVGGLFGSEAKGNVVGHIAGGFSVHVRVGAANAGHTVYVEGEKHVLQQLPVAAYANPFAKLVIGAGAMISPGILVREVDQNVQWRRARDLPGLQLFVDYRAHCITPHAQEVEDRSGLQAAIGSTSATAGEGIGAAQSFRVMRRNFKLATDNPFVSTVVNKHGEFVDSVADLHDAKLMDQNILLEGTQGTGLDNVLGYEYPFVTSRHVTAAGLAADCGLGPRDIDHVLVVARTFPIRVAGNSGPFWHDSREISWADLGIDENQERTTVTKKVRRVATFSYQQIRHACLVNGATEIALMFADYLAPELRDAAGAITAQEFSVYDRVGPMVDRIEDETQTPVSMIGTGPATILDRASEIDPVASPR